MAEGGGRSRHFLELIVIDAVTVQTLHFVFGPCDLDRIHLLFPYNCGRFQEETHFFSEDPEGNVPLDGWFRVGAK